ncbi:hypothetical protein GCM10010394_32230 [Streptomyces crystallinus]|uniref:Uncharacterized protein n=1 Tax=Streptomyces crystallinus TaxID=68191 RepID=A0ABN1FYA0_9ACTN
MDLAHAAVAEQGDEAVPADVPHRTPPCRPPDLMVVRMCDARGVACGCVPTARVNPFLRGYAPEPPAAPLRARPRPGGGLVAQFPAPLKACG